ncbi:MAG: sterol desaturase family protein [Thermodesulfovibrionales bacterium]
MDETLRNAAAVRGILFWSGFFLLLGLELYRPYRVPTVAKMRRVLTNVLLTLFNSTVLGGLFAGATVHTALSADGARTGVLHLMDMPAWLRVCAAVIFMDFMLYVWHLLNHEMPFLWRFHRVHHSDLNMDVSTATRFHIGELAISAVIKIGLIFFLGADLLSVILFESLLVLCAQFQHSSVKVPEGFEKLFWLLFVPPSMHRIHHSVVIRERNTNYGTIFSFWDRLLGTLRKDVEQDRIVIGVGPYRDPGELGLFRLLAMPFTRPIR